MIAAAAGNFDRRITIRYMVVTGQDDSGVPRIEWRELPRIPASRRDIGGAEAELNPQIIAELDTIFRTRWINLPIDTSMQIEDDVERLFEIRSIAELPGRRAGYEILVRNLDAKGGTG